MAVLRANVEYAKQIFTARLGDPYVYGGTWDPNDTSVGCDCSGLVTDILSAVFDGPAMPWDREGLSTESYRYLPLGEQQVGPFTLMHVGSPDDIPSDAAVRIDLHHEGEGGPASHMHCVCDGVVMESNGSSGCCTLPGGAMDPGSSYWNDWWYLPGPIVNGAPGPSQPQQSTFFSDISEFQVPVDDSYPYQVLSIRVCDGTYQDHNFAQNYAWMRKALDSGKLTVGIVYTYVRPDNWQANADTVKQMIDANGGLHPRVVLMLDVESGGNPGGDQSLGINQLWHNLAVYAGNRVIGYGNVSDLDNLWPTKPDGIRLIIAGYGNNPDYPGKIAHQYTDGTVGAGGLPSGASPFGNCDMNVADGLSPDEFAAACGIGGDDFLSSLTAQEQREIYDKIMAYPHVPSIAGKWPSRSIYRDSDGGVDDTVGMLLNVDANIYNLFVEHGALMGVEEHIARVKRLAAGQGPAGSDPNAVARAKAVLAHITNP